MPQTTAGFSLGLILGLGGTFSSERGSWAGSEGWRRSAEAGGHLTGPGLGRSWDRSTLESLNSAFIRCRGEASIADAGGSARTRRASLASAAVRVVCTRSARALVRACRWVCITGLIAMAVRVRRTPASIVLDVLIRGSGPCGQE